VSGAPSGNTDEACAQAIEPDLEMPWNRKPVPHYPCAGLQSFAFRPLFLHGIFA